ncbi:helix-turn-helix domain-containing protein [Actinacidiphila sp. DG2A-62]|uniref:helix-turn-helix domain-containing protein n=1 Tax=Actinacidiphila sp. DG2A-62 TaxID=3108821 RepID=UPI002DB6EF14|nr:helix-turn-helix domain-containing protein [Actinacidiphila sp. DG2A-62]MEC3995000.1 helix-turn-helix domain-containing protein [Actinacidiphila sp. DG2A-62]
MSKRTCALAETDGPCKPARMRGWCQKHYARFLRHGDPLTTATRGKGELIAELRAAGAATTNECIILATRGSTRPVAKLDGTLMLASRAVWILANGDPGEAHVLHTCHRGEEGCINLRHLYLGDNGRNIADMVTAGRSTRGERSGMHKLKEPEVQEIRRLLRDQVPREVIARRFGVSGSTVYQISAGKTWGWLTDDRH